MRASWAVVLVLLAVAPVMASPMAGVPTRLIQLLPQMPSSLQARMLAALARGDLAGAMALWEAQMGRKAPEWLRAFQAAFSTGNQRAGPCVEVAKSIFEGFKQLGTSPSYLRFTAQGSRFLGFEMRAGEPRSTVQVSELRFHMAVQVKDRVYDAFTGPGGLPLTDYLQRLTTEPGATITRQVIESP